MVRRGGQSIVLAGVRGPGTVEQVEQVLSESAVVGEGGTVDSPGRRTGARDGGAGGAGRARVRRGVRRRVGLAGVCRTRISVVLLVFWRCTPAMSVSSVTHGLWVPALIGLVSTCLSVFNLSVLNLSVYHLIANPIACASFPRLTHLLC